MPATRTYPFATGFGTLDRMGALSRVLDQMLPAADAARAAPMWTPPLEIAERADAYLIAVELAGVSRDAIELSFESNVLTIRGTRRSAFAAAEEGSLRLHAAERQAGAFERSVRLPEYVEGNRIEAQHVDGILTITVSKAPAAQPRRIEIASANAAPRVSDHGGAGDA